MKKIQEFSVGPYFIEINYDILKNDLEIVVYDQLYEIIESIMISDDIENDSLENNVDPTLN